MTASVADLLDRLHRQAFAIANLDAHRSADRWGAQAVVWPRLARATMRAVKSVQPETPTDPLALLVDQILEPIARSELLPRASGNPLPNVPPDRRLVDMARVIGGIADLLSDSFYGATSDPSAALGLRANLLSPVMVAANWSLATAPDLARNRTARRHLQLVSGIGAAFAYIPPDLRRGQYDDIAAIPRDENSLDAAIHTWLNAAKDALATRKGLSGMTLQTIAADLSVICGAAAATTNTAITLGQLTPERGRSVVDAMRDANTKWREASRWPQTIYLGGVRDTGLADASIHLRQTVIETLRDGKAWAEPRLIAQRMSGQDLLAVARRAMHAAHEASELQHAAVTNLFWGRDRVMMASRALEGATYMNKAVFKARRRGTWIPMPRFEPSGIEVYRAATNAAAATSNARHLAGRTAGPSAAMTSKTVSAAVSLSQGRIAAPGTTSRARPTEHLTNESPFDLGTDVHGAPTTKPAVGR